jgi:hypothetical protein
VGADINGGAPEFSSWGYAVNYTTAGVGGCQFQLAPGSNVLWAYNYFNLQHLLSLTGPAIANVGAPFTVHVTDGQTGEAISGASIGELTAGVTTTLPSSSPTDASGNATLSIAHAGTVIVKATRAGSVRSNGQAVCVHAGNDGSCGTTSPASVPASTSPSFTRAPSPTPISEIAEVLGVANGHVYSRRTAPRVLRGMVVLSGGAGLRQLRIRLQRRYRGRCFNFSGSRGQFVRSSRCGSAPFFSVGGAVSFSYLLPAPLSRGRYVYDIEAVDVAGHISQLVNGVSHVVFRVK